MQTPNVYATTAVIGLTAGLRSLTAPALLSRAAHSGALRIEEPRLQFLKSAAAANTFAVLAIGELIADKLPFTPNRTSVGPLIARFGAGALCGAAAFSVRRHSPVDGAILGGLAAVGGAFLGYHLRRAATQGKNIPDLPVALAEDAITISAAQAALSELPG